MFIEIDTLNAIERADLARRLAHQQVHDAVDEFLKDHGLTTAQAVQRLGYVHRTQGRIEAIKAARLYLSVDLLPAKCIVDSLTERYGAHFTAPVREVA